MSTLVRSYSKINLGLAIGQTRADGFHSLLTLYQTLALHDRVRVTAAEASATSIRIACKQAGVPADERNTAWKMVEAALRRWRRDAVVLVEIEKRLPIQGGLGAGSGNAAATLLGLERELNQALTEAERVQLAAEVGSDVPLFMIGGSVLGSDRGQQVKAVRDLALAGAMAIPCVVALPGVGVSTPQAFREWDRMEAERIQARAGLWNSPRHAKIEELGRTYASVLYVPETGSGFGTSGIVRESCSVENSPEKLHGRSGEQFHPGHNPPLDQVDGSGITDDLAENSLLALVRTGIENDFESVVFSQHPSLREIKRQLMGFEADGNAALYAALSGSGSTLFGLYQTEADALAAQRRVRQLNTRAIVTATMPRESYWSEMFAE